MLKPHGRALRCVILAVGYCFSISSAFSTCPTDSPNALAPADRATELPTSVTLQWSAVTGATDYSVKTSTAGTAGPFTEVASHVTGTSVSVNFPAGTTITWLVEANAPTPCKSTESTPRSFTTAGSACPTIAIAPAPSTLAAATIGNAFSQIFSATGGSSPYVFKIDTVPPGLQFVGATLSGTPTSTGQFRFVITATDAKGCAASQSYTLTVAEACSGTSATLISPADKATNVSVPVTFSWNAVADATGYNVYLSNAAAAPTLIGSTSGATTLTSSSVPISTLQWFVETVFKGCPSTTSARNTFTTVAAASCPTTPATLLTPADGDTRIALPVAFTWNPPSGGTVYHLFVGLNGDLPKEYASTKDTAITASVDPGKAEWFIATDFRDCPSVPSKHFFFTMVAAQKCTGTNDSAKLLSPLDGTTGVTSPVTFVWSAVANTTSYNVWAQSEKALTPSLIGSTSHTQLTSAVPQGLIRWYVESLFGDCPSTLSSTATLTVVSPTDCSRNTAPTVLTPANDAKDLSPNVSFSWSPVASATGYRLFLSSNGAPFDVAATTMTEVSVTLLVPEGTTVWYVEASFDGCPAILSGKSSFTVRKTATCPTGTVALDAPADGSTITSPAKFSWSAISGASLYRVWIELEGAAPALLGTTTDNTLTAPVPSGKIEWFVEATFSKCPSILSEHRRVLVLKSAQCDKNLSAVLIAPADGATDLATRVRFQWSAAAGAIGYRVWVSVAGAAASDIGSTRDTQLDADVPAGTIEWFVETFFDGCPSLPSNHRKFSTRAQILCTTASPRTVSPAAGATVTSSPVTFIWTGVEDAVGYRLFARLEEEEDFHLIGTTAETSLSRPVVPGTITWYVEAEFKSCSSTVSGKSQFTIPKAAACATSAPQLSSPANQATLDSPDVTFAWSPVSGATGYQVWAEPSEGSATLMGTTDGQTQLSRQLQPGARIEWFVVALFSGCPSTQSDEATFSIAAPMACENQRPQALLPLDRSTGLSSPVQFQWTAVARAKGYRLLAANDGGAVSVIGTTLTTSLIVPLPAGEISWAVEALFDGCPSLRSTESTFTVLRLAPQCSTPEQPLANVVGQVQAGTTYTVRWNAVSNTSAYELQIANTPLFTDAQTSIVTGLWSNIAGISVPAAKPFYYRVRAISNCSDQRGPYSDVVSVVVVPPASQSEKIFNSSAEVGKQQSVVQSVFVPGFGSPVPFTARADKPWLTVTPAAGTLPADGMFLTVTGDATALSLGANTATIILTYGTASKGRTAANATTPPSTIPVSVSLVTPISPAGKNTPRPDSLIIPAIGHAAGANGSKFESDIRVTNISALPMTYMLNFTPSGAAGSQAIRQTTLQIDPGQSTALDDILSSFFGVGSVAGNTSSLGTLEIRPLSTTSTGLGSTTSLSAVTATVASSRTYSVTEAGTTFGQYIPAIPFTQFVGKSTDPAQPNILSIQQVSESKDNAAGYRTNVGLVEAAGEPANVTISVFDKDDSLLGTIPVTLAPGEHRQMNSFLASNNIFTSEARLEFQVTSLTGRISAYASVIDNRTNDPLLVSPVLKSSVSSTRYVIPGVADTSNGVQNWRTDMRLFNASSTAVAATLVYYAQRGDSTPSKSIDISLNPGEVLPIDNALQSFFGLSATGGAVQIVTPTTSNIIATARTYTNDQATSGTYGQFIPAVTPAQSVGSGDRALQVLQLEQSSRFRTNVGLAETTGNPVTLEVTVTLPDSRVTPKTQITLGANEFIQIPVLTSLGLTNAYNARVSVKAISGTGKATAYGSVIDQATGDPTYVPAQ